MDIMVYEYPNGKKEIHIGDIIYRVRPFTAMLDGGHVIPTQTTRYVSEYMTQLKETIIVNDH